jgi:hypothetical protein
MRDCKAEVSVNKAKLQNDVERFEVPALTGNFIV